MRIEAAHEGADNVYIVWLTPSTKICEGQAHGGKAAAAGETRREDQKRELALDNLEVGDHVEIQFTKNDESVRDQLSPSDGSDAEEARTPPHARRICDGGHHPPRFGLACREE